MKFNQLFLRVTAGLVFCFAIFAQADYPKPNPPTPFTRFSNIKEVTFLWAGDPLSLDYHYQVGTTPGGHDILNDDTFNYIDATLVTIKGEHGQTFYARIRYRGLLGYSPWSEPSKPASIDLTPPSLPGIPVDPGEFSASPEVLFTWTPSYDPESGIRKYDFLVRFIQGIIITEDLGTTTDTSILVVGTHGTTIKVKVKATNNSYSLLNGYLSSEWTPFSDGITIDLTAPSAPGTPTDRGDYAGSSDLTFHWSSATEDVSGISCYHITISDQSTNEIIHQNNSIQGFIYTAPGVGLHNHSYAAKVRAQNGTGTWGNFSGASDGITVDLTPPSAPGTPTDAGEYTSSSDIIFDWTAATDSTSGIFDYHLQVGTAPGDSNVFNQWIGNVCTDTIPGIAGNSYYARVRAKNGAGSIGDWSGVSDGIALGILLSLPHMHAYPGDTIDVPLQVQFTNKQFDATEICFTDYSIGLQFLEIDTVGTLVGAAKWGYEVNETNDGLKTAFAGAQDISGEGVFCRLRFMVVGDICTRVPITIESALFNTGEDPVITTDGSVYINPIPFYGDVDENGLVQAHDAAFILKYLVGLYDTLTCQQFANADVTLDSTVSALDATVILQYVVGLIDSLPYVPAGDQLLATASIAMHDQAMKAGQTVELPLYLTNVDNILSFEGTVVYDPDALKLAAVIWPGQLADYITCENNSSGEIRFAGAGSQAKIKDGLFATLRFTVNDGYDQHETVVSLKNLRWNENIVQKDAAQATVALVTSTDAHQSQLPTDFVLGQNYPNPFNPSTTIEYGLPQAALVTLSIYDVNGRRIVTLVDEKQEKGWHQVQWNAINSSGQRVSSGVYLVKFKAGDFVDSKKIILMK
ncbi:T9SS C-terminal target domain-containing protein [candidate division KSB1 bacterium]|nr:T9SS type A sorting domain-containing protein [candidate division KSB1 bacterium]RQW03219.1 MAG: T9SS C-terminal target domain-containing protein [candidate division KSB1 bacterium]